jgi:hypothetical protein
MPNEALQIWVWRKFLVKEEVLEGVYEGAVFLFLLKLVWLLWLP